MNYMVGGVTFHIVSDSDPTRKIGQLSCAKSNLSLTLRKRDPIKTPGGEVQAVAAEMLITEAGLCYWYLQLEKIYGPTGARPHVPRDPEELPDTVQELPAETETEEPQSSAVDPLADTEQSPEAEPESESEPAEEVAEPTEEEVKAEKKRVAAEKRRAKAAAKRAAEEAEAEKAAESGEAAEGE